MTTNNKRLMMYAGLIGLFIVISGCGTPKTSVEVGSFSDAVTIKQPVSQSPVTDGITSNEEVTITDLPAEANDKEVVIADKPADASNKETEITDKPADVSGKEGAIADKPVKQESPPTLNKPDKKPVSDTNSVKESAQPKKLPVPTPAPDVKASNKVPSISWSKFFDNEDQTTPSENFWDLSEAKSTVQIKGFMGEVLSLDKNWFLLIPEPGAECPFDNGDETYWNKIMIVFVKDGSKLRYTSKPLSITGRLDVGIKVDESGYKTMFRLYDAKIEEIKE